MTRATLAIAVIGVLLAGLVGVAGASAASISGHVSARVGGAPIAGIEVCQRSIQPAGEESCTESDSAGNYLLAGLGQGTYFVRFYGDPGNLPWITQNWEDTEDFPQTPIVLGPSEDRTGIDAAMDEGGTIAGTVTAADSSAPLVGVEVCAEANFASHAGFRCARSGAGGAYELHGLPAAPNYQVFFEAAPALNYQRQWYESSADPHVWDEVEVAGPGSVTAGVDAALLPGAEVTGTVTDAATHLPVSACGSAPCASIRRPGSKTSSNRSGRRSPTRPATTRSAASKRADTRSALAISSEPAKEAVTRPNGGPGRAKWRAPLR